VVAYDASANSGEDVSDADFTISDGTLPVVTVTSPNGGENWWIDSFFDIMWTATDNVGVTAIDIYLSTDGGVTFPTAIALGVANDGVYSWLVDALPSTTARVKVVAHDGAGNSGEDVSDANFTISDGTDPVVTVTSPNGGETWWIDSFFDITWVATDNVGVASIDILLSTDGGATFPTTIATGEANDGVYSWMVDAAPSTQARVKVIAYDVEANSGEDVSDANFTISDGTAPAVTLTSPNGGETLDIGAAYDITWTATDDVGVTSITIVCSVDGGASYPDTIATGESNDGVYSWTVEIGATTTCRVKVIAYDAAANSGEDASDNDFEVYDPTAGIDITKDIPDRALITGNSPNPFRGATQIGFGIPAEGRVQIVVYDVGGRVVDVLADEIYSPGYHSVTWHRGDSLGSGLYFVSLQFGSQGATHKMVLFR
jgi:hypothetical protein